MEESRYDLIEEKLMDYIDKLDNINKEIEIYEYINKELLSKNAVNTIDVSDINEKLMDKYQTNIKEIIVNNQVKDIIEDTNRKIENYLKEQKQLTMQIDNVYDIINEDLEKIKNEKKQYEKDKTLDEYIERHMNNTLKIKEIIDISDGLVSQKNEKEIDKLSNENNGLTIKILDKIGAPIQKMLNKPDIDELLTMYAEYQKECKKENMKIQNLQDKYEVLKDIIESNIQNKKAVTNEDEKNISNTFEQESNNMNDYINQSDLTKEESYTFENFKEEKQDLEQVENIIIPDDELKRLASEVEHDKNQTTENTTNDIIDIKAYVEEKEKDEDFDKKEENINQKGKKVIYTKVNKEDNNDMERKPVKVKVVRKNVETSTKNTKNNEEKPNFENANKENKPEQNEKQDFVIVTGQSKKEENTIQEKNEDLTQYAQGLIGEDPIFKDNDIDENNSIKIDELLDKLNENAEQELIKSENKFPKITPLFKRITAKGKKTVTESEHKVHVLTSIKNIAKKATTNVRDFFFEPESTIENSEDHEIGGKSK